MRIVRHLAAFCLAFSTKTPCVLYQNALRFAPKRTVFCTKMHRILHQNAMNFAENSPKSAANCGFMQCAFILYAFTTNPFLHQNQPSRESIFCGKVGDLVDKKGTHSVKIRTEIWTDLSVSAYQLTNESADKFTV